MNFEEPQPPYAKTFAQLIEQLATKDQAVARLLIAKTVLSDWRLVMQTLSWALEWGGLVRNNPALLPRISKYFAKKSASIASALDECCEILEQGMASATLEHDHPNKPVPYCTICKRIVQVDELNCCIFCMSPVKDIDPQPEKPN